MTRGTIAACLCALVGGFAASAAAAEPFPLRNGDVVALVGSTFVEREQRDGLIELALTLAAPDADVTYRNLGWSGDTVTGRARRFFGTDADGLKHLLDHLDAVKPTVIVACYGTNEAFDGEAGREAFLKGYGRLLDEFAERTDRVVIVTPPPMEPASSPDPERARQVNEELAAQAERLKELGAKRGHRVVDLFTPLRSFADGMPSFKLTENGLHYTPAGYIVAAGFVAEGLGLPGLPLDKRSVLSDPLPLVRGDQEALRLAIVAKNALFFHRHRPQNETYLRGFRKHEQGNNAGEIYAFEPLAAEKDREIFKLRDVVPKPSGDLRDRDD